MCSQSPTTTVAAIDNCGSYIIPASVFDELRQYVPYGVMKWAERQCQMPGTDKFAQHEEYQKQTPNDLRELTCSECGGDNVVLDAYASWDVRAQEYVIDSTFDDAYCRDCEKSVSVNMTTLAACEAEN